MKEYLPILIVFIFVTGFAVTNIIASHESEADAVRVRHGSGWIGAPEIFGEVLSSGDALHLV